jgi:hypothetical protein
MPPELTLLDHNNGEWASFLVNFDQSRRRSNTHENTGDFQARYPRGISSSQRIAGLYLRSPGLRTRLASKLTTFHMPRSSRT